MKTKEEIRHICGDIIDSESVNSKYKQAVFEGAVLGYTQCQEDMADKKYTEEEVDKLIRATLTETAQGFMEWLKAETDIVDKDTREVLPNTEIDLKPERNGMMQKYIYPRLVKHGIIFTDESSA